MDYWDVVVCSIPAEFWINSHYCIIHLQMEDDEKQFASNLEEEDYGFDDSSDESTEEIIDYEGMKHALELFQQVCIGFCVASSHSSVVRYCKGSTGEWSGFGGIRATNRNRSDCCFKGLR